MSNIELLYNYPPNTPGSESEGFYRRLNDEQEEALSILENWTIENSFDLSQLSKHSLHPTLTLLKYLRANNFDHEKAREHMLRNIEWRQKMKVDEIVKQRPETILNCSLETLTRFFPHWHCGYDTTGRPVIYRNYGKCDVSKLKEVTTTDAIMRYHIWEQEACLSLCYKQSHEREELIETITVILDLEDMKISQIKKDLLNLVKKLFNVDKEHYPETLGKLFIINVPSMFPLVWRTIQHFIDPAVAAKIHIYGAK